uniref:uncharacterized protein LOC120329034 n=1 Tax=Styela clava TaxID=7725 RepID=UPI001939935D|nr:uncharacterized protein LOC120329034 [Styela clava]
MLRYGILLLFAVIFNSVQTGGTKRCTSKSTPIEQTCTFQSDDATITIDGDEDECKKYPTNCCWKNDRCLTIMKSAGKKKESKEKTVFKKPGAARFLPGFQPPIPPICPKRKPTVPLECKYLTPQPYVLDPPVDVPYCVRIPCSDDRKTQAMLDREHFECGSQPGCYFDKELSDFRQAFGPGVLAGVPVCQLAIRNLIFQREAQKSIAMVKKWSPYYTHCLLERYEEEMQEERQGCKFIDVLLVFKILPKMAGWKGINRRQCHLIDGCWKFSKCFYPYELTQDLTVKSGQRFDRHNYEITFGRPKCQEFDTSTPYTTLKSYHDCLIAGCSVDTSISNNYYHYFFELGKGMKTEDLWKYWPKIERGEINTLNFEAAISAYLDPSQIGMQPMSESPDDQLPPPPPPSGPSDPMFRPPPPAGVFGRPPPAGVFSLPSGHRRPEPVASESISCGPRYINKNSRPCPPPKPSILPTFKHCPYKPVHVPRFDPLKGSFAGCCEVNLCYISRSDIRKMHSGPSRYLTEWSYWTKCTTTCGMGTRTRTRKCIGNDPEKCDKSMLIQREGCELRKCGSWSNWSSWGPPCECGAWRHIAGQTRKRVCFPNGAFCDGEEEESRDCSDVCRFRGG